MGMAALVRNVLEEAGIKPERFSLQWASAAEAPRFVQLITDFTRRLQDLGPLGKAEGKSPEEVQQVLRKALELVESQKLRVSFGNVTKSIRKDGDFSEAHIAAVVGEKLRPAVAAGMGKGE